MMNNYAIVVGIDDYHERPLQGAVNDAEAFADWLTESGEISGDEIEKKAHLKLILSKDYPDQEDPPTDREINRAVKEIYKHIQKNSPTQRAKRLYFYFSGHGLGLTFTKTALCMRPWTNFLNLECISTDKYLDGLAHLDIFDEILFFFDCCRDVDVLANGREPGWGYQPLAAINTKYLVCFSTKYGERSQEFQMQEKITSSSKKRGAFTTFLLKALRGDASNGNGEVRAFDLISHLCNHFKSFTTTLRYVQEADIHHNLGNNDILIIRVNTPPSDFNYQITFKRASSCVELKSGNLLLVKSGSVNIGDTWNVKLSVGVHLLIDCDIPEGQAEREKYIQNHSLNTISYEQF